MQIHIHSNGKATGPYSIEEINQMIGQGSIPASTAMAWYEGLPEWIPAHQLPGVRATASSPPPYRAAAAPPAIPPYMAVGTTPPANDSFVTTIIPTKNPPALASYYLGVFSLIPILGGLLSILAIIFGIKGLKKRKQTPTVKGLAHAIVGIVLGTIVFLSHAALVALIVLKIKSEN